jgi:hypothetical protein
MAATGMTRRLDLKAIVGKTFEKARLQEAEHSNDSTACCDSKRLCFCEFTPDTLQRTAARLQEDRDCRCSVQNQRTPACQSTASTHCWQISYSLWLFSMWLCADEASLINPATAKQAASITPCSRCGCRQSIHCRSEVQSESCSPLRCVTRC